MASPDDIDAAERALADRAARQRIESAVLRARLVLLWEQVWPVVAPLLVLAGLFAIVSWFGLWRVVSDPVRIAILAAFALGAVYLVLRAFRLRAPARDHHEDQR